MTMMKKILIIKLGKQRDENAYKKLAHRSSKLLKMDVLDNALRLDYTLKENKDVATEIYDVNALAACMQDNVKGLDHYDLVLGCIDRPINGEEQILAEVSKDIERNKFYILNTSNIMERLESGKVQLVNFLLNIIYGVYVRKYLGIDPEYHEAPGCLLDYCFLERDLIVGCVKPELCEECQAGIADKEAVKSLNRELIKIRVPLHIRLVEYVKQRTVVSMVIAVLTSLLFGVVSNYITELLLKGTMWQGVTAISTPIIIMAILILPFMGKRD